jgi:hypothetical protein
VSLPNDGKGPGQILGSARYTYPDVDDFGWRDITSEVRTRGVGATDPAWTQIGSSAFYAYAFALNDVSWHTFHVPHDIVPNSQVFFHVHWLASGTDANTVKWQFEHCYAKGFNQAAFDVASPTTVNAEQAAAGVAYQHMVTETVGQTIDGLTEPDGLIQVKITRVTNGGTDNANTIFMLTADVHYQSTNSGTYGKAPDFYLG